MYDENICLGCRKELLGKAVNEYRQVKRQAAQEQLGLIAKLENSGLHEDVLYFVMALQSDRAMSTHPDKDLRLMLSLLAARFLFLINLKDTLIEEEIADRILKLQDDVSRYGFHIDLRHFVALALKESFTNNAGPKPASVIEELKLHMAALKAGRKSGIEARIKASIKFSDEEVEAKKITEEKRREEEMLEYAEEMAEVMNEF